MFRLPIVIQGGYTPLSLPQTSCPQRRLDGSTYNPGACGEVAFANLLRDLRGAGWNVRTVMMNSSILGTPALATQTSALRRAINDAKQETGASKVILFAHSTGGPVARRYIESALNPANSPVNCFQASDFNILGKPTHALNDAAHHWSVKA